jgi:ATP/maltotriose-dependent transcriptional regulator MalT
MHGEFELAEALVQEANATLDQLGSRGASVSHHEALVRLLAGEPERAETALRRGADRLTSMGDTLLLATTSAMLAQAAYAQDRFAEAATLCDAAERAGTTDDIVTQVIWRGVKAKVLAHDGAFEQAERLARKAVEIVEPTDLLSHRADAMLDLGEVLRMCSRKDESDDAIRTGISLHERKGNVAAAAGARSRLGNRPGDA